MIFQKSTGDLDLAPVLGMVDGYIKECFQLGFNIDDFFFSELVVSFTSLTEERTPLYRQDCYRVLYYGLYICYIYIYML